ncbi:lysostaphin resistance A-like protein [Chloroflexota bacterium]
MSKFRSFASRRPLPFVILVTLSSHVILSLAAMLAMVVFRVDQTDPIVAPIGILTATLFLVFLLWRFGWLKAAGVAFWGCWKGWAVALFLLIYYLLELTYSFFGEISFDVPIAAVSGLRVPSLFIGGMFEEILFRGVILYALVSVWGTTRKGVLQAVAISALLFGGIHSLNAISGDPSEIPGQIAIALFESIWWAAIVLRWGSIWPTVFIHVVTNWALQTQALGFPDYHGTVNSYTFAIILELPLALLGVWLILRTKLGHQREGSTSNEKLEIDEAAGT